NLQKEEWRFEHNTGVSAEISVGEAVNQKWRWEMSFAYDQAKVSKGIVDLETTAGATAHIEVPNPEIESNFYSMMGAFYFYLPMETYFRPYLGGGIGATTMVFSDESSSISSGLGLTWKLTAGVDIQDRISDTVYSIEYNYKNLEYPFEDGEGKTTVSNILMKIRFPF
ncbi:MAG: outer membrane beta-barrel protein, partial [Alphaproteobacteria bacterium]|nr:outer membrane beta-barrel protein [Alphaproteobacteria bacterium]